jgi:hypothetical protein
MSEAIKTISLDDIGGLVAPAKEVPKPSNLHYNPNYAGAADQFQPMANAGKELAKNADLLRPRASHYSSFSASVTRMTDMLRKIDGHANSRNYIILGGLILALAAAIFLTSGDGTQSPFASLLGQLGSVTHSSPEFPADDLPSGNTGAVPKVQPNVMSTQSVATSTSSPGELVNPYWTLPNPLDTVAETAAQGMLSPSQEERWRQGLAHPFTWQRHKTVVEMRAARLKGSQFLLNDALAQPKFWLRMEALLALVELGEMINIDTVESGIGSTRGSLIRNYFRRFHKQSTAGELYIMRQAIRIVDAGSRKVILENLLQVRNEVNELYLVAALYDPNPKISTWMNEQLRAQPVTASVRERFLKVSAGMDTETGMAPAADSTPSPAANQSKVQDFEVEQLQNDVNVEEVYFLKDEEKAVEKQEPVDDGFQQLEKQPKP